MNQIPRQELCRLIAEHGVKLAKDKKRCRAFLLDYCGEYYREIFVLTRAVEQDIPSELLEYKKRPKIPVSALIICLQNRLRDHCALTEEAARWAVESWGLALEVLKEGEEVNYNNLNINRNEVNSNTLYNLGDKYYYGKGVEQNYKEAAKWYRRASEINLGSSQERVRELENSLFFSVLVGKVELVKHLIQVGADLNVQDKEGRTPLIYSILASQSVVAEELITAGAKLEVIDNTGHSALHWAIMLGEKEIVELLLKAGSDIFQKNNTGSWPWEIAENYGQEEISDLIYQKKPNQILK